MRHAPVRTPLSAREQIQKDIDTRLAKLLNNEQKKQLEEMREGFRNMGRGDPGGFESLGGQGRGERGVR